MSDEDLNEEVFVTDADAERLAAEYERKALLPDEFWNSSPVLEHVRTAALSRLRSPDAVFVSLLSRYAVIIPPSIVLPPLAGGVGSLNMIVGIVSRSGGRKSSTVAVADDLLPIPDKRATTGMPLGSGEGIAEAFFDYEIVDVGGKKKLKKVRTRDAVHLYVDEGATIVSLGQRNGSTTSSTLRTAWSGGTLGQTNASEEAKRVVTAHTYRLGLVAAFQYSNAAAVLEEAEVGTPQRFLWALTEHPDIGSEVPEWPGELTLPDLFVVKGKQQHVKFAPEIVAEIRQAEILEASGRVIVDPLDTHRRMLKMKVATCIAIMISHKLVVTVEIWELAEMVVKCSDTVRLAIAGVYRDLQQQKARDRIDQRVKEARAIALDGVKLNMSLRDQRVLEAASKLAERVHKKLASYGTASDARRAMRHYRDEFWEALDVALEKGWIIEIEGAGQGASSRLLKPGPVKP